MYVIVRTIKAQKGLKDQFVNWFSQPSVVSKFPGFIKKEVLYSSKNVEYDLYLLKIYWADKQAFYKWEGSAEHIAMHKDKGNSHHKRPDGIIEIIHNAYEEVVTIPHD